MICPKCQGEGSYVDKRAPAPEIKGQPWYRPCMLCRQSGEIYEAPKPPLLSESDYISVEPSDPMA